MKNTKIFIPRFDSDTHPDIPLISNHKSRAANLRPATAAPARVSMDRKPQQRLAKARKCVVCVKGGGDGYRRAGR